MNSTLEAAPGERIPKISVVIPVRNAPRDLRECLKCLRASEFQDFEVIVVDDASTDSTPDVACELDARLITLPKQSGPAQARNQGVEAARGEFVFFIDADVCVHPDSVGQVADSFARPGAPGELAAVFGSYDKQPRAQSFLSQYRNLMHHRVHQEGSEQASTFWTGCGAIRRDVFLKMGGFDAALYRRPCIEDIELGVRLKKAGYRIRLNKQLQVTHLKRWTLWGMLKADVRDRAIPWTQLILREGALPDDLNLKVPQRLCVILAFLLLGTWGVGSWFQPLLLALPVLFFVGLVGLDAWSYRRRVPTVVRALGGLAVLAGLAIVVYWFREWSLIPFGLLLLIVLLNRPFYWFFARERNFLFAALVLPLQVLFYLYSGAAFGLGVATHLWKNLTSRRPALAKTNLPAAADR